MATRNAIRDALLRYLEGPDGFVIAISGPWGSGKTHIWNEIAETLRLRGARTAYASLFGVGKIEDLRGALLTDMFAKAAQEETTRAGRFLASAKRRAVDHIPTILQVLDHRVGAPFLSRIIDPTAFLAPGSYVCLDDLERAAAALPITDILGFANLLAERRHVRVVLIYNEEHVRSRTADFSELSRAYRERVVRHSFYLSPDLATIARSIPADRYPFLGLSHREAIISSMERARCVNLRTLFRAFDRVAEVLRILGARARPAHLAFTVALTIEDAEGQLREPGFYDFSPVIFAFARHRPANVPAAPLEQERLTFYSRHYSSGAPQYEYSPGIRRLIGEGWVEPQDLFDEVVPEIEAEGDPVSRLLADLGTRRLMYFSDAEHEAWLRNAEEQLRINNALSANQISYIYTGCRVSSGQLNRAIAPELFELVHDALMAAARNGDASIDTSAKVFESDPAAIALFQEYERELRHARRQGLVQRLLEAVWARDADRIREIAQSNRPDGLLSILDPPVIEELHATRARYRAFYFDVLLFVANAARDSGTRDVSARLNEYLCVCRMFVDLDKADIHRMNQLNEYL